MKGKIGVMLGVILVLGAGVVWAHSEHEHGATEPAATDPQAAQEQTLTGEVVDVFCYLSHGKDGLGKGHASCAKKCIQGGLPVAIKVGDRLYLASMADHSAANSKLVDFSGEQVEVHGKLMERDGQRLIAITHIEKK